MSFDDNMPCHAAFATMVHFVSLVKLRSIIGLFCTKSLISEVLIRSRGVRIKKIQIRLIFT